MSFRQQNSLSFIFGDLLLIAQQIWDSFPTVFDVCGPAEKWTDSKTFVKSTLIEFIIHEEEKNKIWSVFEGACAYKNQLKRE